MKFPRASTIVASVFGIGFFEFAPGTIMSAIAVPLAILIGLRGGGGAVRVPRRRVVPGVRIELLRRSRGQDISRWCRGTRTTRRLRTSARCR